LTNQKLDSSQYTINTKTPFEFISQTVVSENMSLNINWYFQSINDSISLARAGIIEKEHSIFNRLTAPFLETKFKTKSLNLIQNYKNGMDFQLEHKFKVKIIGIDTIPESTYAYISLTNITSRDKAKEMMKNNATLLTFLEEHELKRKNFPFIIIDKWDMYNDLIDFRFCFAIKDRDSLPVSNIIKFDKLKSKSAIKAMYYGNYKTSDIGWFALYDYALRHEMSILEKPMEFFLNNPFYGGDELEWKAEIFMPINY
jgi:effector-binding domain-containing protein